MKKLFFIHAALIYAVIALSAAAVYADTINIPDDYTTIQAGIDAASDADTVLVQPGTYYENINFNSKNIVVGSLFITTQDTSYISKTVIDGGKNGSVVTFESGEDSTAVLSGFTIQNGYAKKGAGIFCNSSPKLENLHVTNNEVNYNIISKKTYEVDVGGGGIFVQRGNPYINHVLIDNNKGSGFYRVCGSMIGCGTITLENSIITKNDGVGIKYITGGELKLKNVEVSYNTTGIYCGMLYPQVYIEDVIIRNNKSTGLSAFEGRVYLNKTIIYNNGGSGVVLGYGVFVQINNTTITDNINYGIYMSLYSSSQVYSLNSIVWNNKILEIYLNELSTASITYSNIKGGREIIQTEENTQLNWLEGNIDADPLFIDPENGDFRLSPESPCIDAGKKGDIIDYLGSAPDIGAIESDYSIIFVDEITDLLAPIQQLQNFPNPFNISTTISFTLPDNSHARLNIYNAHGQKIEAIVDNYLRKGIHEINWNAGAVSSGLYFYLLETDNNNKTGKMLLLK